MKIQKFGIVMALAALFVVGLVAAEPVFDGQRGPIGANDTKDYSGDMSYTAYGGNITNFNVSVELETWHWVGFWGNVTYNLVLEGTGNNGFYSWGQQNPASGTVMFSPSTNVDWGSIAAGTQTEREAEDTVLGLTGSIDAINNTITSTNAAALNLAGTPIGAHTSVSVNTSSSGGNEWETIFLTDGVTYVYATPIDAGNENYAGTAADFQTMVPVADGGAYSRQYYIYISLDPAA